MANFLGVLLPWLICIPFYTGSGFSNVVNWGGIVFNSAVNFIIPPIIYICMVKRQKATAAKHLVTDLQLLTGTGLVASDDFMDDEDLYDEQGERIDTTVGSYVPPGMGSVNAASTPSSSAAAAAAARPKKKAGGSTLLAPPRPRGRDYEMMTSSSLGRSSGGVGRQGLSLNDASFRQSLMGSGELSSYAAESGLYDAAAIDVRTAEEEAAEVRILGYNPFEAAAEEDRAREITLRIAAEELKKHHGKVTLDVPSIGDPALHVNYSADMSKVDPAQPGGGIVPIVATATKLPPARRDNDANEDESKSEGPVPAITRSDPPPPDSPTNSLPPAGSFFVLSALHEEPWTAMPRWILPHRIRMAQAVAVTLTLIAVAVVILNISECAQGNCS
jgi:hypothetical protein